MRVRTTRYTGNICRPHGRKRTGSCNRCATMSAEDPVRYTFVAFTVAALAAVAAPARADGFVTPYLGYNFGGDSANCQSLTDCEEKHLNFGVSLMGTAAVIGFEEEIGYT